MADTRKRKDRNGDHGDHKAREVKRSKGGSGGKWQTPHQKAVAAARTNIQIEVGDAGIWATCAKGQEKRATEELKSFLEDSAQKYYGLKSSGAHGDDDDNEEEDEDIEKAIQKELSDTKTAPRLFEYVHLDLPCLLFFKARPPIDPVDLVHRICKDVIVDPSIRKMKYINRLSPVTTIVKATEKGLQELAASVLAKHFTLASVGEDDIAQEKESQGDVVSQPSYAIRTFIRAHTNLKRDVVIKQVASGISNIHKVDLTSPDKVIIVEIYQGFCGMSVVDGDWDSLKRYNLAELYPKPDTATSVADGEHE